MIRIDQTPTAQPIMTPANRYKTSDNLLSLAYVKPSIMLLALRNKVLAPDGLRQRLSRVHPPLVVQAPPAGRLLPHGGGGVRPGPQLVLARVLLHHGGARPVGRVGQAEAEGSTQVTVANLGDAVMPVELELGFEDGTTELVKLPVEIWYAGDRYVYEDRSGKTIVRARVNPDGTFPDAIPAQRRLGATRSAGSKDFSRR